MYSDPRFFPQVTEEELAREKRKARQLRATKWWRNKRGRGVCFYCGERKPPSELTMDHVVPLIRGGRSTKSNIVAACKECNNRKKYMLPMEWEEYTGNMRGEEGV